jgi:hypothetical protein
MKTVAWENEATFFNTDNRHTMLFFDDILFIIVVIMLGT